MNIWRKITLWHWARGRSGTARQGTALALYVVVVVVIVIAATSPTSTKASRAATSAAPPGTGRATTWSALISCLNQHPLFSVTTSQGSSGAGTLPGTGLSRNLAVVQKVTGGDIASIGDYGSAQTARSSEKAYDAAVQANRRAVTKRAGQVIYQWTPGVTTVSEMMTIGTCVELSF